MMRKTTTRGARGVPWRWAGGLLALGPLLVPGHGQPPAQAAQAAGAPIEPALAHLAIAQPGSRVRVVVQAQGPNTALRAQVARLGGQVTTDLSLIHAVAATLPARAVATLARTPGVRYVSLDAPTVKSGYTCCSATALKSVYPQAIGASALWTGSPALMGQGIGVAVVDSGIKDVSDMGSRVVARVSSTLAPTSSDDGLGDGYGHGSHVAGIIAGDGTLSAGAYVGVAPRANLVAVRVSADNGQASISDVVNGLQWVYNHRAAYNIRVVNLSLNSTAADSYQVDPLDAAVETLWKAGVVVVAAAGNNGSTTAGVMYAPANNPFVLTVGAVDDHGTASTADDTLASFSASGTLPISTTTGATTSMVKPDLVAPGVNIISTLGAQGSTLAQTYVSHLVGSAYFRMSGTSMAAPMVTGAAALLLQATPSLTPDQVKYRLMATATTLASAPGAGASEVNAYAAVHGASTASANAGVALAASLQPGDPAASWGSTSWGSTSWGSTSWGSTSWGSTSWGSTSWGSTSWGSTSWGSDYWGP